MRIVGSARHSYNDNNTQEQYRWDHFLNNLFQLMNDNKHKKPIRNL